MTTTVERLLRRERRVVAVSLALLALLAWVYVLGGAGMGMSALDMTRLALFPHLASSSAAVTPMDMDMPAMRDGGMSMAASAAVHPVALSTVAAMWWVMMIAMMAPSAAPFVLLYGKAMRHANASGSTAYVPTAFLLAGYLSAWLAFSVAAAVLQHALTVAGVVSSGMLQSTSRTFSALVLAAAGVYQLSPLKHACLARCRTPVAFLTRHWRPGRLGAFRLGVHHGAWCVGCCWLLMALLFVGGVMNVVWIAALALLVLIEKIAPAGPLVGRVSGGLLLAWAAATLVA